MKTYQITEEELFKLLRNSFVAGEEFAEDVIDFNMEEVEEVTELDFDEYYKTLDLSEFEINDEKSDNFIYQPDFGDEDHLVTPYGLELWSYFVYSSEEKAKEDFPDKVIIKYHISEIENPYIIK